METQETRDTKAPVQKQTPRWLLNVVTLVATLLVFALFFEVGLRIVFARSLDFSMEMWKYAVQLKRPSPNPNLSFAHMPNGSAFLMGVPVTTNSHTLRDREYSVAKPPGVYRIVMLGDSTTFGWGVKESETVAKILEMRLNQMSVPPYRSFEVLNAGVGNYDTVQEYNHYLTYDREFHPDLVVIEYFINDAEPVPVEKHPLLLGSSYLVAFTVSRFDGTLRSFGTRPNWKEYYRGLYDDDKPGFQSAKQALRDLDGATQKDGAKLLVTILPELHQINNDYPFTEAEHKIEAVLAERHVPFMELIQGLKGHGPEPTLWVTPEDDHPNGKANSLIVDQMLPWVVENARNSAAAAH